MGIAEIIQLAVILAVSIGMHEYAHAYVSYRLGDPTPKLQGRLTPNPLKHIDPVGFLMIFLIHFGRGKPVQINPMYYKHPVKGELMTSLAGPAMNILLAIVGILIILLYSKIGGIAFTDIFMNNVDPMNSFWITFTYLNIALAVFNLIPIFPLDGYRLIKMFWRKASDMMEQYPMYSILGLIVILSIGSGVIATVATFIFNILFTLLGQIFY
ncbi:MAG: site-2 protease family protein [candidate division SR1 bacterium]|nr:site-2 protease family protein [candidate division SR1 bacterium]